MLEHDRFRDRGEAGRHLAARLEPLRGEDVVVLALPRGGVPVAAEVAAALQAPLQLLVVRKIGVPGAPEVAMGAIGTSGVRVLDTDLIDRLGITPTQVDAVERRERATLDARAARFRTALASDLVGRTAIVVDDGIATGATASVACAVARRLGAARVVLAVPVCAQDAVQRVPDTDELICLRTSADFGSVGAFYRSFAQVSDDEVATLLGDVRASGR